MRHHAYFWRILLFSFLFSSCIVMDFDSFKPDPKPGPELKYSAERLWRREIFGSINFVSPPLVSGSNVYFYAQGLGSVVKINLETGKVLWESGNIDGSYQQPQKIGGYLYQPGINGTITVLDDITGNIAATIGLAGNSMHYGNYAVASGNYLFWSNFPYTSVPEKGLMRLDTAQIDFSKDPYTLQTVMPELVWSDGKTGITAQMLADAGIVYFLNKSDALIAMDAQTGTVLWELDAPYAGAGNIRFPIALHDEMILVIAKNISGYNKLTGEFVFEITGLETGDDFDNYLQYTLHNNFLYYVNKYGRSIKAVNLDSGKTVWSKEVYTHCAEYYEGYYNCFCSENHFYRPLPHVYGNSLFVMSDSGLRVYNAADGTFIGVDKTFVINSGYNGLHSILYNDILVFLGNYPDETAASGYVTAIHCR